MSADCLKCGKCCFYSIELAPGRDHVPAEMVEEAREWSRPVYYMKRREDGSCVALDPVTRRCTIYSQRPMVCRNFTPGRGLCAQTRGAVKGL